MANRFFNNVLDLLPFTRARSADIESHFDSVAAGFDAAQAELDAQKLRGIRAPDSETSVATLPLKINRANKALFFDANGDPYADTVATQSQMTGAVAAATAAAASATAAAASATAAQASADSVAGYYSIQVLSFSGA